MAQKRDHFTFWYSSPPGQENLDIGASAYKLAITQLQTELSYIDQSSLSLTATSTIEHIMIVVREARDKYEKKPKRFQTTRKWLEILSFRILHYARAFDTIASHHQEYVGLAWGAIKLVLMGIMNHADLVQKLSEALVAISNVLPRTELSAALYPTESMEAALSRLYVSIILFSVQCVRWYNRSSLGRLWKAFKDPFELFYQDLVEQIKLCSDHIDALANAGIHAKAHDSIVMQKQHHTLLIELDLKLVQMQAKFDQMDDCIINFESRMDHLIKIGTANQTMINRISVDTHTTNERTLRLEFHKVLKFFAPATLPDAILRKATYLVRRNPTFNLPSTDITRILRLFGDWISFQKTSLLIVQVSPSAKSQAKELTNEMLSHMNAKNLTVFWSLSSGLTPVNPVGILKGLIFQILHQMGELFAQFMEQLNISKIRTQHSEREWADLLSLLLSKVPTPYIVLELHALTTTRPHDSDMSKHLVHLFHSVCERALTYGSMVKVFVSTHGMVSNLSLPTNNCNVILTSLRAGTQVPPRLRHLAQRTEFIITARKGPRLRT